MAVAHSSITDPNIHEPKGAAAATTKQVYVANGAGSGVWQKIENQNLDGISSDPAAGYFLVSDGSGGFSFAPAAHGSIYFSNFGAPYTLAATTAYQKVAPTTTADGGSVVVTEGTNARLTYTGVGSIHLDIVFQASFDQSTGSAKDVYVALYKNGSLVNGSEVALTTTSGEKVVASTHRDVQATTNDYFEIYCKVSASATVSFYTVNMMASTAGA